MLLGVLVVWRLCGLLLGGYKGGCRGWSGQVEIHGLATRGIGEVWEGIGGGFRRWCGIWKVF